MLTRGPPVKRVLVKRKAGVPVSEAEREQRRKAAGARWAKQARIVYRGTAAPDPDPQPRDFGAVFASPYERVARGYAWVPSGVVPSAAAPVPHHLRGVMNRYRLADDTSIASVGSPKWNVIVARSHRDWARAHGRKPHPAYFRPNHNPRFNHVQDNTIWRLEPGAVKLALRLGVHALEGNDPMWDGARRRRPVDLIVTDPTKLIHEGNEPARHLPWMKDKPVEKHAPLSQLELAQRVAAGKASAKARSLREARTKFGATTPKEAMKLMRRLGRSERVERGYFMHEDMSRVAGRQKGNATSIQPGTRLTAILTGPNPPTTILHNHPKVTPVSVQDAKTLVQQENMKRQLKAYGYSQKDIDEALKESSPGLKTVVAVDPAGGVSRLRLKMPQEQAWAPISRQNALQEMLVNRRLLRQMAAREAAGKNIGDPMRSRTAIGIKIAPLAHGQWKELQDRGVVDYKSTGSYGPHAERSGRRLARLAERAKAIDVARWSAKTGSIGPFGNAMPDSKALKLMARAVRLAGLFKRAPLSQLELAQRVAAGKASGEARHRAETSPSVRQGSTSAPSRQAVGLFRQGQARPDTRARRGAWDTRTHEAPIGAMNASFTFHFPKAYRSASPDRPRVGPKSMAQALARFKGPDAPHQDAVITNPKLIAEALRHPEMRAIVENTSAVVREHQKPTIERAIAKHLIPDGTHPGLVVRAYKHAALKAIHKAGLGDYDTRNMSEQARAELKPLNTFMYYAHRRVFDHLNQGRLNGKWAPFRQEYGELFRSKKHGRYTGAERMRMRPVESFFKLDLPDGDLAKALQRADMQAARYEMAQSPEHASMKTNMQARDRLALGLDGDLAKIRIPRGLRVAGQHMGDLLRRPTAVGKKPSFQEIKRDLLRSNLRNKERLIGLDPEGRVSVRATGVEGRVGWKHPNSRVAATFHNHPGDDLGMPSIADHRMASVVGGGRHTLIAPHERAVAHYDQKGARIRRDGTKTFSYSDPVVGRHRALVAIADSVKLRKHEIPRIGGSTVREANGLYRVVAAGELEKQAMSIFSPSKEAKRSLAKTVFGYRVSDYNVDPNRQLNRAIRPRIRRRLPRLRLNTQRHLRRLLNGGITHQERWQLGAGHALGKRALGAFAPPHLESAQGDLPVWPGRGMARIAVNRATIKSNTVKGENKPPFAIYHGTRKHADAHEIHITGPARLIYRPAAPMSNGARVWIEAHRHHVQGRLDLGKRQIAGKLAKGLLLGIAGAAAGAKAAQTISRGLAARRVRAVARHLYDTDLKNAVREHLHVAEGGKPPPHIELGAKRAFRAVKRRAVQDAIRARRTGLAGIRAPKKLVAGAALAGGALGLGHKRIRSHALPKDFYTAAQPPAD